MSGISNHYIIAVGQEYERLRSFRNDDLFSVGTQRLGAPSWRRVWGNWIISLGKRIQAT